MYKVIDKICLGNIYCVSIEGDIQFLKNGLNLIDENGNTFRIETIAMSHYEKFEDYKRRAEVVLCGSVENMGGSLFLQG